NLDFADVSSIMRGMGAAMMGMGEAEGENRALEAAKLAIDNPLLDDISMRGAKGVLINITGGYDMTLFELDEAANEVRREVDPDANIILGSAFDTELEGKIRVSVVAAGVDAVMPSLKQDAPVAETVRQPIAEPIEEEHVEPVAEVESETEVEVAAEEDDRPKVILHHASPLRSGDVDPRDDFTGQSLPAEHFEGSEGEDQIQADAVFSKQTEAQAEEDGRPSPSGFSNLFGWRRGAQGENDHAPSAESGSQIVSSPDDHPEPAPFDDADLEIPAFLRRSANH
ncbi:MAG TPA: cell division protein FtsZ, partial [Hyphomonas sp.]|nr:cell division protein FtsZ [Hyphomonas sp.]